MPFSDIFIATGLINTHSSRVKAYFIFEDQGKLAAGKVTSVILRYDQCSLQGAWRLPSGAQAAEPGTEAAVKFRATRGQLPPASR